MTLDYLKNFGLKDHPFRLTPDTSYFFPSEKHTSALEVLKYALARGEGFLVLTGEPGTGKTLLLRILLEELPADREVALILSPTLSPKELLKAILEDLNIPFSTEESKEQLLRRFKDYLLSLAQEGKTLLLIIDEAQNLPTESLEELRLLSNLETDKKKLVQILLVGQPGLADKLNSKELSQLLQRITVWEKLSPLNQEEILEYLNFRWHRAGGHSLKLENKALKVLYRESGGIPRLLNKIMDRAVLFAAAEKKKKIDSKVLKEALVSLNPYKRNIEFKSKFVILLIGVLILIAFGLTISYWILGL
ncbi:AAA ATPase [Thermodesulfatator indicus DSM 15286]|uniref:AAA ATPase n=1 Tax=Thermodesulfatator indicus (strain DSM 15286 / JCM 11887 / CIR29812) TaxID=667014 RepID=F8ACA5_THEID|nr:AAA family ATPase [Thermodesulfatator indicus]AEH45740.1 AAA ATPase [Thermodesulfatator indicus DSM 15286]